MNINPIIIIILIFDMNQQKLRTLLQENQILIPSFIHYGGVSGFQDYGIIGTLIKNNFLNIWRKQFIQNTDVHEIETPIIIPNQILAASGHVERFTDFVVYDSQNACYRADHLVKDWFTKNGMIIEAEKVDAMTYKELEDVINKYQMINDPTQFYNYKVTTKNLMFPIQSNSNNILDYMRPELAQGIFVNFKQCASFLRSNSSFGLAQVGKSYRNEISPKSLTRMREFTQAEIEYFFDPENRTHPQFDVVSSLTIPILTTNLQTQGIYEPIMINISDAINQHLISHQILGYYLGQIYLFALHVGLKPDKIRFRQHLAHEMAHYAKECWDMETFVNGSWLECIGCADRGSYDLCAHSTQCKLSLQRQLEIPKITKQKLIILDKKLCAKNFSTYMPQIIKYFDELNTDESKISQKNNLCKMIKNTNIGNQFVLIDIDSVTSIKIPLNIMSIQSKKVNILFEDYIPHVIEPSFGVDRLLYSIFEQNCWPRIEDNKRIVLSLPLCLVPYHVAVFPLHNKAPMIKMASDIVKILSLQNIKCYTDNSGVSIGKKYSRLDEIGVAYAITIDPGSLDTQIVTFRSRDTMEQIEIKINDLVNYCKSIFF